MKALVVICLVAASGCAIGAGTSTVGIWRPHREVDTEVCFEAKSPDNDSGGSCARTVEVARDIPARSFGGGLIAWFNPGFVHVENSDGAPNRFALDSHYEYLRGRGPYALGVRVGANLGISLHSLLFTVPVSVVAHWGYPRFSLYGGTGYTPYASDSATVNDQKMSRDLHGFHVMGGGRVLLKAQRSTQMTLSVDVFRQYLQGVVATSATTAIGLHF